MTARQWFTYQEAVEHLADYGGEQSYSSNRPAAYRYMRRAVQDGAERVYRDHKWNHYQQIGIVITNATYNTGTVEYDATGGAYERMMTLTDGVWPTWIIYGEILIGTVAYRVAKRISDTIITLEAATDPGVDISSTQYQAYRESYPLAEDSLTIGPIYNRTLLYPLEHWSVQDYENYRGVTGRPAFINGYVLVGDPKYSNRNVMRVCFAPSATQTLEYTYRRASRQMKVMQYQTGTVATTSGDRGVVGTSTVFTQEMVGSIFRLANGGTTPPGGWTSDNPPWFESQIYSVEDTTHLTLVDECDLTQATGYYTISDPADIHVPSMLGCFLRSIEWSYDMIVHSKEMDTATSQSRYQRELERAIAIAGRNDESLSLPGQHRPARYIITGADKGG